jgi:two-component system NtrC family response regulator
MSGDIARVLIADGDSALRQQLYSALLSLDVFSDCVSSTTEAVAMLTDDSYGVVVVDVALPTGDVERVIERIATLPLGKRPVVLVLAANPEAARVLDVEIVQIVLRKPVNLPQLVDVVRSCTRGSRDRAVTTSPASPSVPHPRS